MVVLRCREVLVACFCTTKIKKKKTAIATLLAKRQLYNAPLLHSAWTVDEVITEACRILESVNYELGTCTPGDWVKLFEIRFSVRTEQHQQRFPQATRSLLARVRSDVLASGALYIASEYVRDRPILFGFQTESHRELRLVPLLCVLGLSPASRSPLGIKLRWLGQFLCGACPLTLPTILFLIFPSQSV